MKSALFWDVTQRELGLCYDVSGRYIGRIFNGQTAQEESREHSGSAAGK